MNTEILNKELLLACDSENLDKIQELVKEGANPNLTNNYGEGIFEYVFLYACERLDDKDAGEEEYDRLYNKVKETVNTLIRYGWDVKKYGLDVMNQFVFMPNSKFAFNLMRFFLSLNLGDDKSKYESLLETVGGEESYQRCCDHNHELENVFYSMYEIVQAKMENRHYEYIDLYYDAVGMKIDKLLYPGSKNIKAVGADPVKYDEDICFVCGEKILVVRECVNILFINNITDEKYIEVPDIFGEEIIGSTITDVSFEHKEIVKGMTHYGQPIILLSLDNGVTLKFTHNFGEHTEEGSVSYFSVIK